ncbi:acyl-CoA thioesterase [Gordonia neofelifaecis]|uniref:Thioesterase superfamily protein n=1 Tax=Gordonia neofelifaecis NRRL B-59395 TaxID=644548 RepID=F1YP33_9ACTN|nr:thioesterase family protein [Gordonia neofelifaecis]EGD53538.1 thioesterase superfamily protein [Gordonia neofelifaecis NRRL B-59395]
MSDSPFVVEIQLRWGDMDPLSHINNVQFARLLEEARVRTMHAWFPKDERQLGFLIARQEIEFVTPLLYHHDPAQIEIWVSRIGEKSFDYGYRMRSPHGELTALAETTCAVIDKQTGRPAPIPEAILAGLRRHTGDEVEFRRRR